MNTKGVFTQRTLLGTSISSFNLFFRFFVSGYIWVMGSSAGFGPPQELSIRNKLPPYSNIFSSFNIMGKGLSVLKCLTGTLCESNKKCFTDEYLNLSINFIAPQYLIWLFLNCNVFRPKRITVLQGSKNSFFFSFPFLTLKDSWT